MWRPVGISKEMSRKNSDERKINKLIGKPISVDFKSPETIGGPIVFLKSFTNKQDNSDLVRINSKCNFEKRPDGLLLHTSFSNKRVVIPIPKTDILEIKIILGKEKIDPIFLSPMWILLKLGVSILYARYFGFRFHEYSIDPMELNVKTTEYEMNFIANGYLFERQLKFLKSLRYGEKLKIERKPGA